MELHGQNFDLETRTCVNGCGLTFKVLSSSTQRTARKYCEGVCMGGSNSKESIKAGKAPVYYFGGAKEMTKRQESIDITIDKDLKGFWDKCVNKANRFADKKNKSIHDKMEIAAWAIAGCHFGTIELFAKAVNVPVMPLKDWVMVREKLKDFLDVEPFNSMTTMVSIAFRVQPDMTKSQIQSIIREVHGKAYESKIKDYLKTTKEMRDFFVENSIVVNSMSNKIKSEFNKPINELHAKFANLE